MNQYKNKRLYTNPIMNMENTFILLAFYKMRKVATETPIVEHVSF